MLWWCGVVVVWCCGGVVLWWCGSVVLWCGVVCCCSVVRLLLFFCIGKQCRGGVLWCFEERGLLE